VRVLTAGTLTLLLRTAPTLSVRVVVVLGNVACEPLGACSCWLLENNYMSL
jgi:hypothetical protein